MEAEVLKAELVRRFGERLQNLGIDLEHMSPDDVRANVLREPEFAWLATDGLPNTERVWNYLGFQLKGDAEPPSPEGIERLKEIGMEPEDQSVDPAPGTTGPEPPQDIPAADAAEPSHGLGTDAGAATPAPEPPQETAAANVAPPATGAPEPEASGPSDFDLPVEEAASILDQAARSEIIPEAAPDEMLLEITPEPKVESVEPSAAEETEEVVAAEPTGEVEQPAEQPFDIDAALGDEERPARPRRSEQRERERRPQMEQRERTEHTPRREARERGAPERGGGGGGRPADTEADLSYRPPAPAPAARGARPRLQMPEGGWKLVAVILIAIVAGWFISGWWHSGGTPTASAPGTPSTAGAPTTPAPTPGTASTAVPDSSGRATAAVVVTSPDGRRIAVDMGAVDATLIPPTVRYSVANLETQRLGGLTIEQTGSYEAMLRPRFSIPDEVPLRRSVDPGWLGSGPRASIEDAVNDRIRSQVEPVKEGLRRVEGEVGTIKENLEGLKQDVGRKFGSLETLLRDRLPAPPRATPEPTPEPGTPETPPPAGRTDPAPTVEPPSSGEPAEPREDS